MPVHVQKIGNRYRVSTQNQTHAIGATKQKAQAQARLLRGVEHGWKPTHETAERIVATLLERDDIGKIPIPPAAKRYARRSGMAAIKRQPFEFQKVNAQLTNPGKRDHFQNYDAVGKVQHAMKG
jgi:hypothetical protein